MADSGEDAPPNFGRGDLFYAPPVGAIPDDDQADLINSLRTRYEDTGSLSTLLWNMRNHYLAMPDQPFGARQVRMLAEGFLVEVATPVPLPLRRNQALHDENHRLRQAVLDTLNAFDVYREDDDNEPFDRSMERLRLLARDLGANGSTVEVPGA